MSTHGLSKSRIMAGIQCPKRLYLQTHQPELADDSGSVYAFAMGNAVGEVAQGLHPGGVLIERVDDLTQALKETEEYISDANHQVLFEGAFRHDGVLIRADVLTKSPDGLHLVEVKSSTSAKDHYLYDCAIQAWVMKSAGYDLARVELAHVDTSFVLEEEGNYQGLLSYVDLTEKALSLQDQVAAWVDEFRSVLAGPMPEVEMSVQCSNPYNCPFMAHCAGEQPEYPVSLLPYGGKVVKQLLAEGIENIRDIPEGRLENERHEWVRRVTVSGKAEVDGDIRKILRTQSYPRYFLDFETLGHAVPQWLGTRPYQKIPFQWSCHIKYEDGGMKHHEFLDTSGNAPMRALTERLIETLGQTGPIFVYSGFEKGVINDLIEMYPDLANKLQPLVERLVDLLILARKYYYHPDMRGSWSIKAVLPTIAAELDYGQLDEVQDGMAAGVAYQKIISGEIDEDRRQALEQALLEYCKLDSLAMVKLVSFFTNQK